MKCYMCKRDIDEGQMYCYTRSGPICSWCVELYNWFVPEFALGKVGFRKSTLELTQPLEEHDYDRDIIDLYLG